MSKRRRVFNEIEIFNIDIYLIILSNLSIKDTFRNRLVCKKWNNFLEINNYSKHYKFITGKPFPWLQYALLTNLDKDWDFKLLSKNPGITLDFVLENPNLPWDHNFLSENPNVTFSDIQNYSNIQWSIEHFSENPNVSIDLIYENPDLNWDFRGLMTNRSIKIQDIRNNPELDWDYESLSFVQDATIDDLLEFNVFDEYMIDSLNTVTIDDVLKYCTDIEWRETDVTLSPQITLQDILNNPKIGWTKQDVYMKSNVSIEMLLATKEYRNLDFIALSNNWSISYSDVLKYNTGEWSYQALSYNPGIRIQDVLNNPNHNWCWRGISTKYY